MQLGGFAGRGEGWGSKGCSLFRAGHTRELIQERGGRGWEGIQGGSKGSSKLKGGNGQSEKRRSRVLASKNENLWVRGGGGGR